MPETTLDSVVSLISGLNLPDEVVDLIMFGFDPYTGGAIGQVGATLTQGALNPWDPQAAILGGYFLYASGRPELREKLNDFLAGLAMQARFRGRYSRSTVPPPPGSNPPPNNPPPDNTNPPPGERCPPGHVRIAGQCVDPNDFPLQDR